MVGTIVIAVEGIEDLPDLDEMTPAVTRAARRAVNAAIDRARTWSADAMRKQVNFPPSYLRGPNSRLKVVKRAKGSDLDAVLRGRFEPTSLARFAQGGKPVKRGDRRGMMVEVEPGVSRFMPRTFLMRLQAGDPAVRNLGNRGLAIRLPKGKKPDAAYKPKKIDDGLWLLYGPSVDQVFRSVADDVQPDVDDYLNREFLRLMELENG